MKDAPSKAAVVPNLQFSHENLLQACNFLETSVTSFFTLEYKILTTSLCLKTNVTNHSLLKPQGNGILLLQRFKLHSALQFYQQVENLE